MELKLIRIKQAGEAISGILNVDGEKLCDTAENTKGALKAGSYKILRHFCKQYNRFVPAIVSHRDSRNPYGTSSISQKLSQKQEALCEACPKIQGATSNTVLKYYCPQLKMGNGVHNRNDGSIIMGTTIIPGCLKFPRAPYENLSERIRKLDGRGSDITFTILETYGKKRLSHFNFK